MPPALQKQVLYKKTSLSEGIIKSSLFRAAQKDNIEPEVIIEFARVFGFEIDFQRDIRKNDIFQIVYEKYVDDDGEVQKSGDIICMYILIGLSQKSKTLVTLIF